MLSDGDRRDWELMKAAAESSRTVSHSRLERSLSVVEQIHAQQGALFRVDTKPVRLKARLLPSPFLQLTSKEGDQVPSDGIRKFYDEMLAIIVPQLRGLRWLLACDCDDDDALQNQLGGRLPRPVGRTYPNEELLKAALVKHAPVSLVIVVLPRKSHPHLYRQLKTLLATQVGIISQMLTFRILSHRSVENVMTNVVLQIGCKLLGARWGPPRNPALARTMFVGVDVCHEGGAGQSSVGFVSSLDADGRFFHSEYRRQARGREMLADARELMRNALEAWKSRNGGALPEHVLVYRDGVSNSQLVTVMAEEVAPYEAAWRAASGAAGGGGAAAESGAGGGGASAEGGAGGRAAAESGMKLTVVVVQKRVSARFFTDGAGNSRSPPVGTVVDSDAVSSIFRDFYLVSADAHPNVGVATPTRYIVLRDDMRMSPDDLQGLTLRLCYCYPNWLGSVRVPGVCQLAHKAAKFAADAIAGNAPFAPSIIDTLHFL